MQELAKQKLPGLHASNIDFLLTNSYGLLAGPIPDRFVTRMARFNNSFFVTAQNFIVYLAGPLVFEAYAYVQLFSHVEQFNIAAFISLIVTASFIVVTMLQFINRLLDPVIQLTPEP